jgi:hypothetical protein
MSGGTEGRRQEHQATGKCDGALSPDAVDVGIAHRRRAHQYAHAARNPTSCAATMAIAP